ncbi:hypothetical protein V8F06_001272 [Rhypophila decipiens]
MMSPNQKFSLFFVFFFLVDERHSGGVRIEWMVKWWSAWLYCGGSAKLWMFCFYSPQNAKQQTKEKGLHESTSQKSLGVLHETAFNAGESVKKHQKTQKQHLWVWLAWTGKENFLLFVLIVSIYPQSESH